MAITIVLISALILGAIALVLMIKLISPMRKPTAEEMTTYIQMMEKGGKLK